MHRGELIYWQGQCSNYSAPADEIVSYEGDPAYVYRLASMGRGYRIRGETFNNCVADLTNEAWNRLYTLQARPLRLSGTYRGMTTLSSQPRSQKLINAAAAPEGPVILFMHQRQSASGIRRLVLVELEKYSAQGGLWNFIGQSADTRWYGGLGPLTSTAGLTIHSTFPSPDGATWQTIKTACFFAGQPDRHDASRFTIAYELDGQEGILDGQLNDDGRVHLAFRSGPATQPAMQVRESEPSRPD